MKSEALSLKVIIKELDFLRKAVIIQWNTWKILLLLPNKLTKQYLILAMLKMTMNHLLKKPTKSIKQPKTITYQWKTFENPNIADMKSIITEHSKTSHKLSKTIRQDKKLVSNSPLYNDKKGKNFFKEKEK